MMAGMQQSQVHTSDLDLTQDSIRTSASGGSGGGGCYTGLPVKLLVRGFSNAFTLDDLWQLFTTYGEVSSVILESHGATITYKEQCSFPMTENNMEVEVLVGDQKMMVSRVHSWPSLDLGAGDGMDPYLMYYPSQCVMGEYPAYTQMPPPPAPLYYPHIPPPLSPHYDAAILDIGHANVPVNPFSVPPPPIPKTQAGNAFTFPETHPPPPQQKPSHVPAQDAKSQPRGAGGCHVCSASNTSTGTSSLQPLGNKLQPLTPMTPSYPNQHGFGIPPPAPQGYYNTMTPPPTFYLPTSPVSSTLLSLSGTSFLSTDSSASVLPIGAEAGRGPHPHSGSQPQPSTSVTPGPSKDATRKAPTNYQIFMSPYKRFSKFSGVPTPARFPLVNSGRGTGARSGEEEDISSWYQAGDRWGHRRTRTVSEVDLKATRARGLEKAKSFNRLDESVMEDMANLKLNR